MTSSTDTQPAAPIRRAITARATRPLLALLVPQIALGAYLVGVPDGISLETAELATLTHVLTALATLPLIVYFAYRHTRAARSTQRARSPAPRRQIVVSWALAVALVIACGTGLAALSSGHGMPVATSHAIAALVLACAFGAHIALTSRGPALALVAAAVALPLSLGLWLRERGAGAPLPAPTFVYATKPVELYDPAHWCGECHTELYAEWHRSAHARTLGIPQVKRQLSERAGVLDLDLESFGKIAAHAGVVPGSAGKIDGAFAFESCTPCHSPTSFYGNDPTNPLTSAPPSRDGVTCSFCHTLRAVRPAGDLEATVRTARARGEIDPGAVIADLPLYVSAPETVRRYFGQGSPLPIARALGNLLVRWRPEVHRRDYHAPLLDQSELCSACHGAGANARESPVRSYPDWQASRYNTGSAETTVRCQDCHMGSTFAAKRVDEPRAFVPWGPVRPRRASHLFLGGNVDAANVFLDTEMAAREHALNEAGVAIGARFIGSSDGRARVAVTVRSLNIGHYFPAVESNLRYAWVKLRALDAAGVVLGETADPDPDRLAMSPSPILFRCLDVDFGVGCDTAIPPGGERTFDASVPFHDGAPVHLAIELHHTMDPRPIAAVTLDVGAPSPP